MADVSYQQIREQFISLQVELEEKQKVCAQLEQKIEIERAKLGRIEADATEEYEAVLRAELEAGQEQAQALRTRSAALVDQKKMLLAECQRQVEAIKDKEASQAAEKRHLYHQLTEALEEERRVYRRGHEQRLAKFLASRAAEEKESTGRALGPEFSRLRQQHELELADVEAESASEERRLRANAQVRHPTKYQCSIFNVLFAIYSNLQLPLFRAFAVWPAGSLHRLCQPRRFCRRGLTSYYKRKKMHTLIQKPMWPEFGLRLCKRSWRAPSASIARDLGLYKRIWRPTCSAGVPCCLCVWPRTSQVHRWRYK